MWWTSPWMSCSDWVESTTSMALRISLWNRKRSRQWRWCSIDETTYAIRFSNWWSDSVPSGNREAMVSKESSLSSTLWIDFGHPFVTLNVNHAGTLHRIVNENASKKIWREARWSLFRPWARIPYWESYCRFSSTDCGNNLDPANVCTQDFDRRVDPKVVLGRAIGEWRASQRSEIPPVSIAVRMIPHDHTSTGSPR